MLVQDEVQLGVNSNFYRRYLLNAPIALAMERSLECELMSKLSIRRPVLDLGCGDGLFAQILFADKIDCGVDKDPKAIEEARTTKKYRQLICCQAHNIPRDDQTFQTIISNSALEHMVSLKETLKEAHRLLANDGRFYLTVPTPEYDQLTCIGLCCQKCGLRKMAERFFKVHRRFWKHHHVYSIKEWQSLFEACGFRTVAYTPYSNIKISLWRDLLTPFALFSLMTYKMTKRWILLKKLRPYLVAPIYHLSKNWLIEKKSKSPCGLVFFELNKERV